MDIVNETRPMIIMPVAGTLKENKHSSLPMTSTISSSATIAISVLGLKSSYMFSLGQLCGDGCNIILNKQKMYSIK